MSLRRHVVILSALGAPLFAQAPSALDSTIVKRARTVLTLSDSTLWPEGVDYDPRTQRYYVTSVRHGTVVEVSADGRERELWPRNRPGMGAMFGVRFDTTRRVLWVTTSGGPQREGYAPGDSAIAALMRIRVSDGHIERRWDLPAAPRGHALGDLVIGPRGEVLMTDSYHPFLYRLRSDSDTLEAITNPLFRSLQGLAFDANGTTMFVADYSRGLLRVDLDTRDVIRLEMPANMSSRGCDGIAWADGGIICVQNGAKPSRIVKFTLDSARTRISSATVLDNNATVATEPTIGVIVGDEFVYVANSQWEQYTPAGQLKPGATLSRPLLRAVRVRP
jgi:sugar lactone lactonase YvrE